MPYHTTYPSPVGTLLLVSNGAALTGLSLSNLTPPPTSVLKEEAEPFPEVLRQLDAYFSGDLTRFDVPLAPTGTPFQKRVWEALQTIPYGETTTYGAIAAQLGVPNACRAVGTANGSNPISILIPCHRVVGANGKLTGYSGGLSVKAALLKQEGVLVP
jgi:methylated-DNA-[protein]-cysteine S-methyltransferase